MVRYLEVKVRTIHGDESREYQLDSLKDWVSIELKNEDNETIAYMEVYASDDK